MSKLTISFSFDASAPCAVSTFLFATEDVSKGCALTSKFSPQPAPVVLFDKGLGLKFPAGAPEGESASAAMQHVVDMSSLQRWTSSSEVEEETEVFPLVIRLEVINERGLKNGKTLKEIVPGGEQKDWVQSQTTYATIKHEDDGGWTIKVLKQKIWVEGVSYELQEIYGLEHAAESKGNASSGDNAGSTGTTDRADDAEERLCVICLVNPRDTTVLPCRHMCLCSECAGELRKQTSKCPICRNNIESLLHIKISKEGRKQAQAQSSSQGQS